MADASKVPTSKDWQNKYDNSDLVMEREAKDIASGYTDYQEMRAYREYLEALKMEAELLQPGGTAKDLAIWKARKDGSYRLQAVPATGLIGRPSEFEMARRNVLIRLNDETMIPQPELKKLMAQFETNSIFELSSKITNYVLDQRRKKQVANQFDIFA